MKWISIIGLALIFGTTSVHAAGLMEVSLGPQFNQRSGYLAQDRTPVGVAFSLHFFGPAAVAAPGVTMNRSFFDFQFATTKAGVSTKEFPFASNHDATESLFAVVPNLSFFERGAFQIFAGVGPTLVTISQNDPQPSNQTYGTFLWQLGARYEWTERWALIAKANYYSYESQVNGEKTFFANAALRTELGYTW